ncbi:MAG: hypothetical protein CVU06_03830 [Bacteroidetes bacterium HGW-Bacteroidetes-22]|nr:MAG: hypothetical protein CVU06_03830 [Bacteroidetes bacterium HGW-Bacteroidetes-22]
MKDYIKMKYLGILHKTNLCLTHKKHANKRSLDDYSGSFATSCIKYIYEESDASSFLVISQKIQPINKLLSS